AVRLEQPRVRLVLADRLGAFARGGERLDEPVLRLVVERVGPDPALRGLDGAGEVASRAARVEPRAARLAERARVERAPAVHPRLPRVEIGEVHAVEERAGVEAGRGFGVAALEGGGERVDVRVDAVADAQL